MRPLAYRGRPFARCHHRCQTWIVMLLLFGTAAIVLCILGCIYCEQFHPLVNDTPPPPAAKG